MTNTFTLAVAVIGGFTATTLGFASAATAAPSGVGNAQDTINALQSQGFNVILNGAAVYPLSGCKVTGIEDSTAPTSTHQDAGSTQPVRHHLRRHFMQGWITAATQGSRTP